MLIRTPTLIRESKWCLGWSVLPDLPVASGHDDTGDVGTALECSVEIFGSRILIGSERKEKIK